MKRLITMITAAVVGACAWADSFTSSVESDISTMTNGQQVVGYDTTGKSVSDTDANVHWWATNWVATDYEQPVTVITNNGVNNSYLEFETDAGIPVLRTFSKMTEDSSVIGGYKAAPVDIDANGLFVDTEVQFTASETAPTPPTDAKILVWLQAIEADDTADPAIVGSTNLMVTCGYKKGDDYVTTNYVLVADVDTKDKNPTTWYRLTIRGDKMNGGTDRSVFKIYLNETQLATADGLKDFPALIGGDDNAVKLSSVGYEGCGNVQKVDLRTSHDAPSFAKDPTSITFTWDDNVSAITIGGVNIIDGKSSPYAMRVTEFGAGYMTSMVATVTCAEGYRVKTLAGNGFYTFTSNLTQSVTSTADFTVAEFAAAAVDVAAVIAREEATCTIGGTAWTDSTLLKDILTHVNTLGETSGKVVITLGDSAKLGNITLSGLNYLNLFEGENGIELDLHGCTIVGTADNATANDYLFFLASAMTIKDTVGGGAMIAPANAGGLIYDGVALTLDEAASGDIKYTGLIKVVKVSTPMEYNATLTINGGKCTVIPTTGIKDHEQDGITLPDGKKWSSAPDSEGFYTLVDAGTVIIISQDGTTTNYYTTLQAAFDAAESTDTVALLANQELATWVTNVTTVTLDLNGFSVTPSTSWDGKDAMVVVKRGGNLTIKDTSVGQTGVIDSGTVMCGIKMTMKGEDATGTAATFTLKSGTIKGYEYGISGNGLRQNTAVTIEGGAVYATATADKAKDINSIAIYNPQSGSLTITGGWIEGDMGIYIKAGTCTTTVDAGATIVGHGAYGEYARSGDGAFNTGDAFVIENTNYPGGAPLADIKGGTFVSSNSTAVSSYAMSGYVAVSGFVSGGSFNTDLADGVIATGSYLVKSSSGWGVQTGTAGLVAAIGKHGYATITAALAASEDGDTVTLLADVTTSVGKEWNITNDITFAFADKRITKTTPNDWVFKVGAGANVTFTGTTGGIMFKPIELGNRNNPASMIQNLGNLTISGGVYVSDFCIVKNDEDPSVSVFTSTGGTFEITPVTAQAGDTFEGQWALMNWATATINGGIWKGPIGTRASDNNNVSNAGTTDILKVDDGSDYTVVLRIGGRDSATTCTKAFPKVKRTGLTVNDVALEFNTSITDSAAYLKAVSGDYITVRRAIEITSVSLGVSTETLKVGATTNLVATVEPANADVTNTVWTSSNEAIATVDQNGLVTAVAAGEATITVKKMAQYGADATATCTFTVQSAGYKVEFAETVNGTVETSVTNDVAETTTVTIIATPKSGFVIDQVAVSNVAGTASVGITDDYKFNMPDCDVKVYATFKSAAQPVTPGTEINPPKGQSASDYADAINAGEVAKSSLIAPATGSTVGKDYYDLFTAVAGESTVTMELNSAGTQAVVKAEAAVSTNALEAVLAITTSTGSTSVTIAKPLAGFYYSFKQGSAVDSLGFKTVATDANQAASEGVAISFTADKTEGKGFYQTLVTTKPVETDSK